MRSKLLRAALAALSCATAQAQLTNQDECANASFDVVGPGAYAFDNSQATGATPAACASLVLDDIWFVYLATRTGMTTIHTCSTFETPHPPGGASDTVIQAFAGTACPPGAAIGCGDEGCHAFSSMTFPVTAGQPYLIQIGSFWFGGDPGTGTVEIVEPQCFDSRIDWQNACGGPSTAEEGFEGFTVDTSFEGVALPIAVGTIEAINGTGFRNFVDVPPFQFNDHNGTKHASCFTNADPPSTIVRIELSNPAEGFGAAVTGATDGEMAEMAVYRADKLLAVCVVASNDVDQWVGFLADNATLDRVDFQSINTNPGIAGESFGMDRVAVCAGGVGPIGTTHCNPAAANSTGVPATMSATGSNSAAAQNVLITVDDVPPGQFGHFFASRTPGFVPNPGTPPSQGNLCVSGNIGRYNCVPCGQIGQGPSFSLQVGNIPVPVNPVPEFIMPGDTWYWQAWYRDVGNNTNFSNALGITFVP